MSRTDSWQVDLEAFEDVSDSRSTRSVMPWLHWKSWQEETESRILSFTAKSSASHRSIVSTAWLAKDTKFGVQTGSQRRVIPNSGMTYMSPHNVWFVHRQENYSASISNWPERRKILVMIVRHVMSRAWVWLTACNWDPDRSVPFPLFPFSSEAYKLWNMVGPVIIKITSSILRYWLAMTLHGVKHQSKLGPCVFQHCCRKRGCQGLDWGLTEGRLSSRELNTVTQEVASAIDEKRPYQAMGNSLRVFTGHAALYVSPITLENE